MKVPYFHLTHSTVVSTIKAIALLGVVIVVYFQDLILIANDAIRSDLMSYVLVVPFLFAYLIYRKRKMLGATSASETTNSHRKPTHINEITGVLVCLTALLLYWYGSFTFFAFEYHRASLPIFLAGCAILLFNVQTLKTLAFPTVLLLFFVPQTQILGLAASALSVQSASAVYSILKVLGLPVTPTTIYSTPGLLISRQGGITSTFIINRACSGINSILGFIIFSIFAAHVVKGTIWKKALMLLMGFPLIYIFNVLRIVTLVCLEYQFEIDTTSHVFHLFGEWTLIFTGTLLLLFLSKEILKIHVSSKTDLCPEHPTEHRGERDFCLACGKIMKTTPHKHSKREIAKIGALLLSASLIAYFQMPVFASRATPLKVNFDSLSGEEFGNNVFPQIPDRTLRFVYRDLEFEDIARQDASLVYAYLPENQGERMVLIALEIAQSSSSLHGWEVCLMTWPQTQGNPVNVEQLGLEDIQLLQNPPLPARFFTFRYIGEDTVQTVLYWNEYTFFDTGTAFERECTKISLVIYSNSTEELSKAQSLLLPIGQAIANHWQPTKTWSPITIIVAENGPVLIALTTSLIFATIAVTIVNNREEKRRNLVAYSKLRSVEDKTIIKAVQKESKATFSTIASTYQKLTGEAIESERLLKKLQDAEKAGLIERKITGRSDKPILIWKSNTPIA